MPALIIPFSFLFPEPALTIPFPTNKFPNKLAPNALINKLKNPPFCSFVSFLVVLVTLFSKILESSRASTICVISFEIIKFAVPEPCTFFWIPASISEAAAVIPNGAKTYFADGIAFSLMDLLINLIITLKILQTELF